MSERTDRELLELAAKAAGIEGHWATFGQGTDGIAMYIGGRWNPLTDDADALRLAVKLRIHITMNAFGAAASGPSCGVVERDPDVLAATRRAIVRCAAEIGAKP